MKYWPPGPQIAERRDSAPVPCLVETIQQRARRLGVSELTIRRRVRSGHDGAFHIGGTWRLPAPCDSSVGDLPTRCSVRQTANSLGVSMLTVRRWISSGEIPAVKDGRAWSIPRHYLEDLFDGA
jgi:excisionase family DNA binding protein